MKSDCKAMEFLFLFAQINHNVKPMIHYALNRQQLQTTGSDCQQAAEPIFCHQLSPTVDNCRRQSTTVADSRQLSPTVDNCRRFSASRSWSCIIVRHGKVLECQC